ncbi:MAG: hypothetical protein GX853_09845, partial [Chloroflexi bacterium]|nr:hypothetical protein [Chloroflexota bacterium]
MSAALDAQWSRAQQGLVEIIRFGAMLSQVARQLEAPTRSPAGERVPGHGWNKGTGLKAWLAEHCPTINYKTAYGYMVAANGLAREARLAADVPLLSLMGEDPIPEPRAEKLRARVFSILEGASLSLLKAAATSSPPPLPTGGPRDGAGRPPKDTDPNAALNEALILADKLVGDLSVWVLGDDGFGNLPDDVLQQCVTILSDITKRGRDILSGRKLAAKAPGKQGAQTNDTLSDTIER